MLIEVHPENPGKRQISQIVECLKGGGVIIYPTDTVYGLGCDITNKKAMERVCRIRNIKPEKANLSFICSDLSHLSDYAKHISNPIYRLMNSILPGPFTFILEGSKLVPKLIRSGKSTVGIRVPDNKIAMAIVEALGNPIISTSLHSKDEILDYRTDPYNIHEDFGHLVDIVVDGGAGGIEPSTIIDCTSSEPIILREGKGMELLNF
ncbi:MAG: tRNA threonylcarbamoyl adenosine modification protein (Sua5/YciO/YrdC/YwlC family) [Sphingobacteriales bacterium]|jgi:tRNA threonylcarbamoyl adenosine modification protein (Sua5/YciO/YrdC/YwlC family)